MRDAEFDQIMKHLLDGAAPRVWSLLVTMFGDLAISPETRLSGASVNAITATIGIKPEATRVALHRLRKEGWIESHRTGRQSRYGLTEQGRTETNAAWSRVYGPAPEQAQAYMVMDDPTALGDAAPLRASAHTVPVAPRIHVSRNAEWSKSQWAVPLPLSHPVPQWVADKLCPPEVQVASQTLYARFAALRDNRRLDELTLLQRTALRVVIVHEWRRLILRVPAFQDLLFSDKWLGLQARRSVHDLLTRLPSPNLTELEATIDAS